MTKRFLTTNDPKLLHGTVCIRVLVEHAFLSGPTVPSYELLSSQ